MQICLTYVKVLERWKEEDVAKKVDEPRLRPKFANRVLSFVIFSTGQQRRRTEFFPSPLCFDDVWRLKMCSWWYIIRSLGNLLCFNFTKKILKLHNFCYHCMGSLYNTYLGGATVSFMYSPSFFTLIVWILDMLLKYMADFFSSFRKNYCNFCRLTGSEIANLTFSKNFSWLI